MRKADGDMWAVVESAALSSWICFKLVYFLNRKLMTEIAGVYTRKSDSELLKSPVNSNLNPIAATSEMAANSCEILGLPFWLSLLVLITGVDSFRNLCKFV